MKIFIEKELCTNNTRSRKSEYPYMTFKEIGCDIKNVLIKKTSGPDG